MIIDWSYGEYRQLRTQVTGPVWAASFQSPAGASPIVIPRHGYIEAGYTGSAVYAEPGYGAEDVKKVPGYSATGVSQQ